MGPEKINQKISAELSLAAFLSTGITLVITPIYIVLCILALVYRVQCNAGTFFGASGDSYFIYTLYRIYIQTEACGNTAVSPPAGVQLMSPNTVFIFVIIIFCASVLCSAAAITLIVFAVNRKNEWIFATAWTYICVCLASLLIDIIFAAFFGRDFAEMSSIMDNTFPGINTNYLSDVLRLGSLLFMTIALKGYFVPVINITLLVLLAVYATNYRKNLQTDKHSIHKVGAINAYEQHVNRGFVREEEPRRSPRSLQRAAPSQISSLPPPTPMSEYASNREYDRSTSWQHSPAPMPFSYMEEPRRLRASPTAAAGEQWRRDPWPPAPPVPAPDYSPPARRLKSALKPNYM